MPKQFEGMGFTLMYPDTWTIAEENPQGDDQGLILESPGGAFLSVNVYETDADPLEIVEEATKAMEAEYEDIESEPFDMTVAGIDLEGTIQRFYYLDFVVVSKILAYSCADQVYLIQIQGEDRDVDQQSLVFEAILTSMMRSLVQS